MAKGKYKASNKNHQNKKHQSSDDDDEEVVVQDGVIQMSPKNDRHQQQGSPGGNANNNKNNNTNQGTPFGNYKNNNKNNNTKQGSSFGNTNTNNAMEGRPEADLDLGHGSPRRRTRQEDDQSADIRELSNTVKLLVQAQAQQMELMQQMRVTSDKAPEISAQTSVQNAVVSIAKQSKDESINATETNNVLTTMFLLNPSTTSDKSVLDIRTPGVTVELGEELQKIFVLSYDELRDWLGEGGAKFVHKFRKGLSADTGSATYWAKQSLTKILLQAYHNGVDLKDAALIKKLNEKMEDEKDPRTNTSAKTLICLVIFHTRPIIATIALATNWAKLDSHKRADETLWEETKEVAEAIINMLKLPDTFINAAVQAQTIVKNRITTTTDGLKDKWSKLVSARWTPEVFTQRASPTKTRDRYNWDVMSENCRNRFKTINLAIQKDPKGWLSVPKKIKCHNCQGGHLEKFCMEVDNKKKPLDWSGQKEAVKAHFDQTAGKK